MQHRKRTAPPALERNNLVTTADRIEAYRGKTLIGYADRDDKLWKIDKDGYAVEIGTISHRTEIFAKLGAYKP